MGIVCSSGGLLSSSIPWAKLQFEKLQAPERNLPQSLVLKKIFPEDLGLEEMDGGDSSGDPRGLLIEGGSSGFHSGLTAIVIASSAR